MRLSTHTGVSTFGEKPDLVGPDHLADLIEHALEIVPQNEVENTPIFLLATAGMRLLPEYQRTAVLDNICSYFQKNTKFQLPDCDLHIQVIPGETEGLYGWIAANYLLGGFDAPTEHNHGKGHHTYGFLDMGGASAQIAFAPNATEAEKHANDLKLLRMRNIRGEAMEFRVFVTTWLGFGVNEARRRYIEALLDASPGTLELPDPCLPSGLTVTKSGHVILPDSDEAAGKEAHLLGTGTFTECLKRTFPLLDKDAPCEDPPCLLHGVHVPAIDFDVNHFVGVSEYWHTTHEVFEMAHKDKAYDFHTYQQRVLDFCSQDWATIRKGIDGKKWGKKVDETTAVEVCFKASWLINMLHDGIGIPRVGLEKTKPADGHFVNGTKEILDKAKSKGFLDPFQAVNKINDVEVSWTLGKMVLYAASQVPPVDDTLAVGFGSNIPGTALPKDFQFAGGRYKPLPDDLTDNDDGLDDDLDWHDRLFSANGNRRVPGLVLFILILLFAAFLLAGRERRSAFYGRILGFFGRPPHSSASLKATRTRPRNRKGLALGMSKLFRNPSSGPSYERVLEDGANGFELGSVSTHSDDEGAGGLSDSSMDSAGPRTGRTSGWATPKVGFDSPALSHSSPKRGKGYFDGVHSGIPAFERGGLTVRTESRERLAPLGRSGSKSRHGSPTRMGGRSPLMMPVKEQVD